ncbi:MAG: hypothetical protein JWP25_335 [Bradyrhizobium sp.]|nr:hypothetical protein [Bradyrhizobium sp.]
MQITLKRALKLRKELEAIVAKVELPTSVAVSLLIDENVAEPTPVLKTGCDALLKRMNEYVQLSEILSDIRTKIAKANAANGIEDLLASNAHAARLLAIYKKLAAAATVPPHEQVVAELKLALNNLNNPDRHGYGRAERSVAVPVIPGPMHDDLVQKIAGLKRLIDTTEDERTAKNAAVKIEIAEEDVSLLLQLGII